MLVCILALVKTLALFSFLLFACASETTSEGPTAVDDELVGGTPDSRWLAAGYLVHAPTAEGLAAAPVSCGATLVAPDVVVTAAHCVLAADTELWAFGTGNAGSAALTPVVGRRIHPDFHPEPETHLDVRFYLRNCDLATLRIAQPLTVPPARLPDAKTPVGCNYSAVGYRTETTDSATRVSTGACVQFRVDLGGDPIFEVHPTGFSALCHGDGDEGSPLFDSRDPETRPVLHGIYVGSVTQGLTDCRRGTQFLNGYEAMFGFREFVQQSIDEAR